MYSYLTSDHPIDLCRYQVANCYMGRAGLINSGGASGASDFEEAVATAVINKRSEEHTSELQSRVDLVCRLLLEKKKKKKNNKLATQNEENTNTDKMQTNHVE